MYDRQSLQLDWITSNQVHFKQNKKMFALNEKNNMWFNFFIVFNVCIGCQINRTCSVYVVTLLRHLCQIELVKK